MTQLIRPQLTDEAPAAMEADIKSSSQMRPLELGGTEYIPRNMVIEPRRGLIPVDWRELKEFRELFYFLVWRDIKIRYKQTVLGVAWAVLQPVLTMLIFSVIFGRFAGIPSDGHPYPIFVYAGLLPWTFFSVSVTQASQSLLNQQHLLTKVYLPRLFLPAASVGGSRSASAMAPCSRAARAV